MEFDEFLNKITLGDSYELIKEIPDKSIDLVIIDPPYEYMANGGAGCFGTKKRRHDEIKIAKGIDYGIIDKKVRYEKLIYVQK